MTVKNTFSLNVHKTMTESVNFTEKELHFLWLITQGMADVSVTHEEAKTVNGKIHRLLMFARKDNH